MTSKFVFNGFPCFLASNFYFFLHFIVYNFPLSKVVHHCTSKHIVSKTYLSLEGQSLPLLKCLGLKGSDVIIQS